MTTIQLCRNNRVMAGTCIVLLLSGHMRTIHMVPCISAVHPLSKSFALMSALLSHYYTISFQHFVYPYSSKISTSAIEPAIDAYMSGVAASFVCELARANKIKTRFYAAVSSHTVLPESSSSSFRTRFSSPCLTAWMMLSLLSPLFDRF